MGRVKQNRGRRDGMPSDLHWTPLQQSCGCVVEWGWDTKVIPPPVFVEWCLSMIKAPCVWHGAETGKVSAPEDATVYLKLPNGPGRLYVRRVRPEWQELGVDLTSQALELSEKLREDNVSGILVDIPAKYQRVMRAKGFNPAETWIEMRMMDIFLNLGRVTLTSEMIEKLPEPKA
jgi:hypothetical protein